MKAAVSLGSACLLALVLSACGDSDDNDATASSQCFNCHSETTELGYKISWAKAGWEESVHAKGQVERHYLQIAATDPNAAGATRCTITTPPDTQAACVSVGFTWDGAACTVPATVTQNACESAGGTWVGPRYVLGGQEHAGSNANYANAASCQICHTEEGFRKRVEGAYDEPGFNSIKFAWDSRANAATTVMSTDVIQFPTPIGCFGCHTPHGKGTTDNETLDQTVPVGTAIGLQTGAIYGNATSGINKAKGHMCAECHQVRLGTAPTVIASILGSATGTSATTIRSSWGPHHGPQADMLLGVGGAQYAGASGTSTFAGTYFNSAHTGLVDADCVSCHMQSDYSDIDLEGRLSVSPAVGGHAFTNKGMVHGNETVLTVGCGSRTEALQCHTVGAAVPTSSGSAVKALSITRTSGYLQAGDARFQKYTDAAGTVDSRYHLQVNELMLKLANPATSCTGLISAAATLAGSTATWATLSDGTTVDQRCIGGDMARVARAAAPQDDNTVPTVRLLKALWNYRFVGREDKSFGVHNTRYALELLYDSCMDLTLATGGACGATAGRCTACEGQFVTTRP